MPRCRRPSQHWKEQQFGDRLVGGTCHSRAPSPTSRRRNRARLGLSADVFCTDGRVRRCGSRRPRRVTSSRAMRFDATESVLAAVQAGRTPPSYPPGHNNVAAVAALLASPPFADMVRSDDALGEDPGRRCCAQSLWARQRMWPSGAGSYGRTGFCLCWSEPCRASPPSWPLLPSTP